MKINKREILERVEVHMRHASCAAEREKIAISWCGYVASLIEWRLIRLDEGGECFDILMKDIQGENPAYRILNGD